MINTVIFDMDGTLLNTLEDLTDSVNYTMDYFGYPERTIDEVRSFVGNGIGRLIRLSVPEYVNNSQYEIVLAKFKSYYTENCQNKTKAYDGVMELIHKLNDMGIKMAIVSNKNEKALKELNKLYFGGIIDVVIGDVEGRKRKPEPDSVFEALKQLDSSIDEAVYVGDSDVDFATAGNAGIRFVAVTWGFRDRDMMESLGTKCFINAPLQLLDIIKDGEING